MNTKLYRKCWLYRKFFEDILIEKEWIVAKKRVRRYYERKAEICQDSYHQAMRNQNYDDALEYAYYYKICKDRSL